MRFSVSLRGTISALSAAAVAVVAAITLTLCLTSSLSALYGMGKDHAAVLLRLANVRTEALFAQPGNVVEALVNFTASTELAWPSDDPTVFDRYVHLTLGVFLQSNRSISGAVAYFRDNTRFYTGTETIDGEEVYVVVPFEADPVSIVGFDNTTVRQPVVYIYAMSDNRRRELHEDLVLPMTTQSSLWETLETVTGGTRAVYPPQLLVVDFQGARFYLSAVAPMFAPGPHTEENFRGFAVSTMDTARISEFLNGARYTSGTVSIAVDNNGYVVASSAAEEVPFVTETEVSPTAEIPNAGCATTASTAGAAAGITRTILVCRVLARAYGVSAMAAGAADDELMTFGGQIVKRDRVPDGSFFFAATDVPIRYPGLRVRLLLAMPEAEVLGRVVESRNVAIAVTAATFVLVGVVVFSVIRILLLPLETMATRMHKASTLDDDDPDRSLSAMTEVRALQEAYYEMNSELRRIRGFVPQAALLMRRPSASTNGEYRDGDVPLSEDGCLSRSMSQRSGAAKSARSGSTTSQRRPPLDKPPAMVWYSNKSNAQNANDSGASDVAVGEQRRSSRSSSRGVSNADGPSPLALVDELHAGPALPTLGAKFAGLLQLRPVTVLVANTCDFLAHVSRFDRPAIAQHTYAVAEAVLRATRKHRGVLDAFHGDHYIATFNAARPCTHNAREACLAALQLAGRQALGPEFAHLEDVRFKIGLASGRAVVGNVGSARAASFSTLSTAVTEASILERMTRVYGCSILAQRKTCAETAGAIRFLYVDAAMMSATNVEKGSTGVVEPIAAVLAERPSAVNAKLGAPDDEWLHTFQAADPCHAHNATFESLASCSSSNSSSSSAIKSLELLDSGSLDGANLPFGASSRLHRFAAHVREHGTAVAYVGEGQQRHYFSLIAKVIE